MKGDWITELGKCILLAIAIILLMFYGAGKL
jgi:hypothetical protein